jgi:hypothetical protein
MCKLAQYRHVLVSTVVSYEFVPWSILRPNCRKLKNAGVFVQRSPNHCFAGSEGFPDLLAAAVPHGKSYQHQPHASSSASARSGEFGRFGCA